MNISFSANPHLFAPPTLFWGSQSRWSYWTLATLSTQLAICKVQRHPKPNRCPVVRRFTADILKVVINRGRCFSWCGKIGVKMITDNCNIKERTVNSRRNQGPVLLSAAQLQDSPCPRQHTVTLMQEGCKDSEAYFTCTTALKASALFLYEEPDWLVTLT